MEPALNAAPLGTISLLPSTFQDRFKPLYEVVEEPYTVYFPIRSG